MKSARLIFLSTFPLLTFLEACTLIPPTLNSANIRISIPERDHSLLNGLTQLPSTVDDFDCYAVNVYGSGIGYGYSGTSSNSSCPYPGIVSSLVPPSESVITLQVPTGPSRTIQMIGVATGSGCQGTLANYLNALSPSTGTSSSTSTNTSTYIALLGQATTDLYRDAQVTISNTYSAPTSTTSGSSNFPFQCSTSTTTGTTSTTGTKSLSLVAAYTGYESITAFSDSLSGILPPAALSPLAMGQLTLLQNPLNTTPVYVDDTGLTTGYHARLDLVFSLDGVDLTNMNQVFVTLTGAGGVESYSGSCLDGTTLNPDGGSQSGLAIGIYNPTTPGWYAQATMTSVSTTLTNITFSTAGLTPSTLAYSETGNASGNFIHLSIRSRAQSTGGSSCSNITLQSVSVSVSP